MWIALSLAVGNSMHVSVPGLEAWTRTSHILVEEEDEDQSQGTKRRVAVTAAQIELQVSLLKSIFSIKDNNNSSPSPTALLKGK
jgi:hypothetical protein